MSWQLDGKPVRRILVTRLRYLGDIVMSTVVVQALRKGDSGLEIGYLCEAPYAPVLQSDSRLDHLHILDVKRHGADGLARRGATDPSPAAKATLQTILDLRQRKYDLAIDLFFNPRSAWLLRLSGIRRRICGAAGGRRRLYTHTGVTDSRDVDFALQAPGGLGEHLSRLNPLHNVESGLHFRDWFLAHNSSPVLPRLEAPVGRSSSSTPGYVLLVPGATWPTKQWPIASWRKLTELLLRNGQRRLRILSAPGGSDPAAELAAAGPSPGLEILPARGLSEVLKIISDADAVIAVDGGILHCAVALGRPVVGLFGPTSPSIWFPYAHDSRFQVLCTRPHCHPCDKHVCGEFICLPDLRPEAVIVALQDVLSAAEGRC